MKNLASYIREHRGFTINILLALYGLVLDPILSGPTHKVLFGGETNYTLAVVVFVVLLLELLATPYKISAVFYDLAEKGQSIPVDPETGLPRDRFGTILFTSSLFRLAVSAYLITMMMAAVGIKELTENRILLFCCVGFVLIKEIVYFVLILWRIKRPKPVAAWKVTLGDVFYALFYDFVFTVFWGLMIVRDQTIRAEEGWSIVMGLILVSLVFCLVFLPIRLPYLIEEFVRDHTPKERMLLTLSFFLALGAGLKPALSKVLVGRHTSLETARQTPERVQSLYLQRQRIRELPAQIGQMKELRILYLYSNHLTTLPPEIGQLSKLESLNLMYNRLHSLPTTMGQLQSLHTLHLYRNQLTQFPSTLGQLKELQILDARYNRLQFLPDTMGSLQKLRELHLDHNKLQNIPWWICELRELRKLSLRHNPIHSLPRCLRSLPHLKNINLYGTPYYEQRMRRFRSQSPSSTKGFPAR